MSSVVNFGAFVDLGGMDGLVHVSELSWKHVDHPGSVVQVGDGIEGLVHISEMSAHHVDLPEQVVTPGEELWVKIIDLDLQRRRISLSIKQAAEGGIVAAEYQEHFGEHAYDDEGNYIGGNLDPDATSEGQEAWVQFYAEQGFEADGVTALGETPAPVEAAAEPAAEAAETTEVEAEVEAVADAPGEADEVAGD